MSEMWVDDYETEDYDSEDYDGEDYDGEDVRSDRRKLERRRAAILRAQRRQVREARGRTGGAPAGPRSATAAVRTLDLETKVDTDSLRRAIADQSRRTERASYAAVASVVLDQAIDSFDLAQSQPDHIRAVLRVLPLMILTPQKHGSGAGSLFRDPRVLGAAGVGGVVLYAKAKAAFDRATTTTGGGGSGSGSSSGSGGGI